MTDATFQDLLIEIGCEELPPKSLDRLSSVLFETFCVELDKARIEFDRGASNAYCTPRRLALSISAVADRQPDVIQERRGPAVAAAFDDAGQPTRAAEGFARSVGKRVDELGRLENDSGAWLFCMIEQAGKPLSELVFSMLERALGQLPVNKPMRWSDNDFQFVRPVHWLVMLHGKQVLKGRLMGQMAGRETRGHRIHSPGPHSIAEPGDYLDLMRSAFVLANPDERRTVIRQQAQQAGASAGGRVQISDELLREVSNLVEWPVAVEGSFEHAFLSVPHEALIASMQDHLKFFPVFEPGHDRLAPAFIAISNLDSKDFQAVREGYERVIRPRLADARFFWEQDLKKPLSSYNSELDRVVFQKSLGSVGDKSRRVAEISKHLADIVGISSQTAIRAAELARADLVTLMVNEFPELQGTMGAYYAEAAGETKEVCAAIRQQYSPAFAGDGIPGEAAGRILAVADRLDTLVGIFGIGLKPTGNKDPFALRRAAIGLVRILEEGRIAISIERCLAIAANALAGQVEVPPQTLVEVREFIVERLRHHYREKGHPATMVNAALSAPLDTLQDLASRLESLQRFMERPEAETLVAANKRIGNILRKSGENISHQIDTDRFILAQEQTLFAEVEHIEKTLEPLWAAADYDPVLAKLAGLKNSVDDFFDHVMVMDEDPDVRLNRLNLLFRLKGLFDRIADFALMG